MTIERMVQTCFFLNYRNYQHSLLQPEKTYIADVNLYFYTFLMSVIWTHPRAFLHFFPKNPNFCHWQENVHNRKQRVCVMDYGSGFQPFRLDGSGVGIVLCTCHSHKCGRLCTRARSLPLLWAGSKRAVAQPQTVDWAFRTPGPWNKESWMSFACI